MGIVEVGVLNHFRKLKIAFRLKRKPWFLVENSLRLRLCVAFAVILEELFLDLDSVIRVRVILGLYRITSGNKSPGGSFSCSTCKIE